MYTIGNFSNLCNVPVKTVRYYSEIGLLNPSYVDPVTSYRYYDYDKMKELKTILILKKCQFSLDEIGQFLNGEYSNNLSVRLQNKADELKIQQEQITKKIKNIEQLNKLLQNEKPIISEPALSNCYIERRESLRALSLRKTINIIEIDTLVKELFERIYAFQLTVDGKLLAIFHQKDQKQNKADVELLLPVKAGKYEGFLTTLPEGNYACVDMKGPYSELHYGYRRLKAWLTEHSLSANGMYMEEYVKGLVPLNVTNPLHIKPNDELHPNDFLTKVFVKIG
ncbi:MerR family transcriptional regulator [Virgibacillus sp. NKC19-3]|uniref:MerR family transcriptional regulator n=1 Tax=Virgibacillus saliphilus TaxID=2831674 RepID=UPI001C9AB58C|nr:MerR family transcriptional regulator [Virgibacillus sp. NKC19-3]MBY7141864.1 MerR family transcriptional regulator [Virgibacillus sp. NKC19-3]